MSDGVFQQSQGSQAPEPPRQVPSRRRRPRNRSTKPKRVDEKSQMDRGVRREQEQRHTPQELPWPLLNRKRRGVFARHDRKQGVSNRGREGPIRRRSFGLEVRVGAHKGRVPSQVEKLVW